MKKVIDADNQKILGFFDEKDTEAKVKYYESLGQWGDVGVDKDGDIILWKE